MKVNVNWKNKELKTESVLKVVSAILTALLLFVGVTLMMLVKDNQERIKSLESRLEAVVEVWDSQFKTLRAYTVDFEEWELMKVGEVW